MSFQDPQWIIAIANSIVAAGLLLVVVQVWYSARGLKLAMQSFVNAVKQLELNREALDKTAEQVSLAQKAFIDSHDLERRKKAIILLKDWSRFIYEAGTGAKSFAEKLDFKKSELLWIEESFEIDTKQKGYLEQTVPAIGQVAVNAEGKIALSSSQVSILRKQVVSYLNLLETILSARRHNVADPDMLKEQFGNLVVPREGKHLLTHFRAIAGGVEAFPSIELFVKEIEDEKGACLPSKAKLGQVG